MNRKTGQRKKPAPVEPEDSTAVEEVDESELEGLEPSYITKVQEYLAKEKIEEQPKYYLYRYDNYDRGEGKALFDKFLDCDPPDEHDIGMEHGSGRWLLIMVIPGRSKGNIKAYRFRTHPRYDSRLTPRTIEGQPGTVVVPYQQPRKDNGSMTDALAVIERLMCSIIPLVVKDNSNPSFDMGQAMINNYTAMNAIMKKQMMENIELLNDLSRDKVGGEEVGTTTEDEPTMIEQLSPFLNQVLPMLLGGGAKAQAASAMVQSAPQFKSIIEDRGKFRKIVKYLDEKEGKDKTDKLLKTLKLKRT